MVERAQGEVRLWSLVFSGVSSLPSSLSCSPVSVSGLWVSVARPSSSTYPLSGECALAPSSVEVR